VDAEIGGGSRQTRLAEQLAHGLDVLGLLIHYHRFGAPEGVGTEVVRIELRDAAHPLTKRRYWLVVMGRSLFFRTPVKR